MKYAILPTIAASRISTSAISNDMQRCSELIFAVRGYVIRSFVLLSGKHFKAILTFFVPRDYASRPWRVGWWSMTLCNRLKRYELQCTQSWGCAEETWKSSVGIKHIILRFYSSLWRGIWRYSDNFYWLSVLWLARFQHISYCHLKQYGLWDTTQRVAVSGDVFLNVPVDAISPMLSVL